MIERTMRDRSERTIPTRMRRMNRPPKDASWIWLTEEMMASPAFRLMSRRALLVVFRICVEHMAHRGHENGRLVVTYQNFREYGVAEGNEAEAIREAVALGWIAIAEQGGRRHGETDRASRYRLTWLPRRDGETLWEATNEWKAIATDEDARSRVEQAKRTRPATPSPQRRAA